MVNVRVWGINRSGEKELLKQYYSPVVPRVGEWFCVQYWVEKITKVEWYVVNDNECGADVFVLLKESHHSDVSNYPTKR